MNTRTENEPGRRVAGNGRARDDRPVGELLRTLSCEVGTLFEQEMRLARAEMHEKAQRFARHTAMLTVGGALLYAGVLALIAAAVFSLAHALVEGDVVTARTALWLSALVVGLGVTIIGAIMLARGKQKIRDESLMPRRTARSLRETTEWMKSEVRQ